MRRRDFISLLGGAAAAWPLAARGQQGEQMRRIGVLTTLAADDPEATPRHTAFVQELQALGWTVGRNMQIDTRWGASNIERARKAATELLALAPDIILTSGGSPVLALQQTTRSVPIVFTQLTDPVGSGFVESLARPGGNITGFTLFEFSTSGKWLELLKEMTPGVKRVAVLRDVALPSGMGQFAAIQSAAVPLEVEVRPLGVRDASEIERGIMAFAQSGPGGLVVTSGVHAFAHRELILTLAARHRLPAVYSYRGIVARGGLISYGSVSTDAYRRAASYVDRILKGEKPADLPVQAPVKYELVINLKTARALGLDVPPTLIARADEVIE